MKIAQLRYFLAVCKHGSFSNASKTLFVSQPAISQAIRDLENEYNVVLFLRNNNHLELTDDGKWLQQKAENLLRMVDELSRDLIDRAEKRLVVKTGVAPMIGNLYFYPMLNDMQKQLPDLVLDVKEAGSLEIRRWLETGTIDFGFCLLDCVDLSKYNYTVLNELELKLCVHKTHPLANKGSVSFAQLANHQICLLGEDSFQNKLIKQKFEQANVKPNVLMYSSQLSSIFTLLSYGICCAFMFDGLVSDDYVLLSMDDPIFLKIGMIWDPKLPDYSPVHRVRRFVRGAFKKFNSSIT
ncbi:MAG: LysR substrate-binding domain-containing protein [Candidatus Fimimonas sp.]